MFNEHCSSIEHEEEIFGYTLIIQRFISLKSEHYVPSSPTFQSIHFFSLHFVFWMSVCLLMIAELHKLQQLNFKFREFDKKTKLFEIFQL